MHVIAVSHNRLDSSNHAVANTTSNFMVELTVASHAMHENFFLKKCTYDPPTGYT